MITIMIQRKNSVYYLRTGVVGGWVDCVFLGGAIVEVEVSGDYGAGTGAISLPNQSLRTVIVSRGGSRVVGRGGGRLVGRNWGRVEDRCWGLVVQTSGRGVTTLGEGHCG